MEEATFLSLIVYLTALTKGGVELLADGFVVLEEACRKCISNCGTYLLGKGREDWAGVVAHNFVDDHRPYVGVGRHAECSDLGLDDLTDIGILFLFFGRVVVIDVGLALGLARDLGFCNILIELYFGRSRLVRCWGSRLGVLGVEFVLLLSGTAWAVMNEDGRDVGRRHSHLQSLLQVWDSNE